jgi:hypothetical protein
MRSLGGEAAPTIPASLSSSAGTTGVRVDSSGTHLCAFLLTPPPTMIRSGHTAASRTSRVAVHPLGPLRVAELVAVLRGGPDAFFSPSVAVDLDVAELGVGHQVPSVNRALPMPVPKVSSRTTPPRSRPAP